MCAEEEEIAAPENEDRSAGRMGSVCNIRRPAQEVLGDSVPSHVSSYRTGYVDACRPRFSRPAAQPKDRPHGGRWSSQAAGTAARGAGRAGHTAKRRAICPGVPTALPSAADYATYRERLGMLRAFERRLGGLLRNGKQRVAVHRWVCASPNHGADARASIVRLDATHPEFSEQYRANYDRALKESGIPTALRRASQGVWKREHRLHAVFEPRRCGSMTAHSTSRSVTSP